MCLREQMNHKVLLVVWLYMVDGVSSVEYVHHDNEALQNFLLDINTTYPDITHLYTIGQSVRDNHYGVNLDIDFPHLWDDPRTERARAPETRAVIEWISQHTFVISASIHTSQVMVVNYPYDGYEPGGMLDYNYLQEGVLEVFVSIACCKFPNESTLQNYWNENIDALLNFNFEVHRGVKGIIKDENNKTIEGAVLTIKGRTSASFNSSKHGEYFRVLLPGTYTLQVLADKYLFTSTNVTVIDGGPTRQDFTLKLAPTTISPTTTSTSPTTSNTPTSSNTPSTSNTPTNSAVPTKSVMPIQDIVSMCGWISIIFSAYL